MKSRRLPHIRFVSKDDYDLLFEQCAPRDDKLSFEAWSCRREALVSALCTFGRYDCSLCDGGDFGVGDDWFGSRHLAVIALNARMIRRDVIHTLHQFVCTGDERYVVTLVNDFPETPLCLQMLFSDQDVVIACSCDADEATKSMCPEMKPWMKAVDVLKRMSLDGD